MDFTIQTKDQKSKARLGMLSTSRNQIPTPVFMPVGTAGTVKAVHQRDLLETVRPGIILANTYHLYLRPGTEVLEKAGGLHRFMSWDGPILTDSGGYQVYSLAHRRKITPDGVSFQSHIDGSTHFFSPEKVMDIQRMIGADVIMAFDECTPYPCPEDEAKKSMDLTHNWLKRCVDHLHKSQPLYGHPQSLFPIVQGSTYKDLREASAETVASLGLEGHAIGGLSVGEPAELMYAMTSLVCDILPEDKPRYLMGVGTPENILECIALGVDMFDCVMPTRNARNGMLFTASGIINIRNRKWEKDFSPIDPEGTAFVDSTFSRAYLRHLFISNEMLGPMIATLHNLRFYLWLTEQARTHIASGTFSQWKNRMLPALARRL